DLNPAESKFLSLFVSLGALLRANLVFKFCSLDPKIATESKADEEDSAGVENLTVRANQVSGLIGCRLSAGYRIRGRLTGHRSWRGAVHRSCPSAHRGA